MSLTGQVALVTGGARGIGKAICDALLEEKVKVCITDVLEDEGDKTLKDFQAKYGSGNVIFHKLNVVDENEFENVVIKTKHHFGHLDILCNNAGLFNETKRKEMIEINLMGVVNGIQTAHKHLENCKGEKGGTVINTASLAGIYRAFPAPLYSATKHAIVCLTQTWGNEKNVEVTKVKVSAVCPDFTKTVMLMSPPSGLHDDFLANFVKTTYKDKCLKPSDVANGVLKILHDNTTGGLLVISKIKGNYYHTANEKDFTEEMSNV